MSNLTRAMMMGAAGAASGSTYVDDVFSTFVYTGTSSAGNVINNGIDLAGEGGIVWVKNRGATDHHLVTDEAGSFLTPSTTESEFTGNTGFISSFNSNGFTLGQGVRGSNNGDGQVSWTFRKAPGFFDVVTYTGNGTAGKQIAHNLGSMPGMIIVKKTSGTGNWFTANLRADGAQYIFHRLNASSASFTSDLVANVADASNVIIDGTSNGGAGSFANAYSGAHAINENGATYVAYIFAHNDAQFGTDGDESIIKCGTYTGTGNTGLAVNVGFEPQFLLVKTTTSNEDWVIVDNMRGVNDTQRVELWANKTSAEYSTTSAVVKFTSTGFETIGTSNSMWNNSGGVFIYMAIRRPNKPPEAATEVFAIDTAGGTSPSPPKFTSGFVVDWALNKPAIDGVNNWLANSRLTGNSRLYPNNNSSEDTGNTKLFDFMKGYTDNASSDANNIAYMFKRAPGFMDVVAYSGNGQNRMINHNLAVVPEMYICKERNGTGPWYVYHSATGNGAFTYFYTNSTSNSTVWNSTSPTATQFSVGANESNVNGSSGTFISYLFATLPGISKVGSYTGTGNDINVNCGFTNGARFVLVKRTDVEIQGTAQDTDWYLWDTTRGIVSGNDPWLALNDSQAQVTNTDYIDPLSTGFTITAGAGNGLNVATKLFIFFAIA